MQNCQEILPRFVAALGSYLLPESCSEIINVGIGSCKVVSSIEAPCHKELVRADFYNAVMIKDIRKRGTLIKFQVILEIFGN